MQTYLVSYDLAAPTANRNAINTAIMMLGQTWARPLEHTWFIKTDLDEADIESVLGNLLSDDDGLIVQCVRDGAYFANTSLRWFKQRPLDVAAQGAGQDTNIVAFPVAAPLPCGDVQPLAEAV